MKWQAKHTDCALWAAMTFGGSMFLYLTTAPDAKEFLSPVALFWIKGLSESFTAMSIAVKVHRGCVADSPKNQ